MKVMKAKNRNRRENSEIRGTCGFLAATILAYLVFICAVKGHSFILVGVFVAALLVSALISALAFRLTE